MTKTGCLLLAAGALAFGPVLIPVRWESQEGSMNRLMNVVAWMAGMALWVVMFCMAVKWR